MGNTKTYLHNIATNKASKQARTHTQRQLGEQQQEAEEVTCLESQLWRQTITEATSRNYKTPRCPK